MNAILLLDVLSILFCLKNIFQKQFHFDFYIILLLFTDILLFTGAVVFQLEKFGAAEDIYYFQIVYFICMLFFLLNDWRLSKAEAERKRRQEEEDRKYYEAYDELRTLVRERQHDMNNHISAILGMAYTIDDRDELIRSQQTYYKELKEGYEEIKLFLSVENRRTAGFFYLKMQEAMEYQIKVMNRIIFREKVLIISEHDLIEITGILLDNAIEALAESRETVREIHLEIVNEKESLRILVSNSSRPRSMEEMAGFFQEDYTSKGKGRGLGLKKLRRKVHGMGGEVIVSGLPGEDAWFVKFEVVIPGMGK